MNFSTDSSSVNLPTGLGIAWVLVVWILTAIVHIGFAFAILADSQLLWKKLRRNTFFVGGGLWALATLLGGVLVAAIYWLIHHSTLRPQQPPMAPAEKPEESSPP